jgi:hypothetical protein
MENLSIQDLDAITTWEAFSFDGKTTPATGVLCKWADGHLAFYDPREHRDTVADIRFIESDDDGIVGSGDDECGMVACFGF